MNISAIAAEQTEKAIQDDINDGIDTPTLGVERDRHPSFGTADRLQYHTFGKTDETTSRREIEEFKIEKETSE